MLLEVWDQTGFIMIRVQKQLKKTSLSVNASLITFFNQFSVYPQTFYKKQSSRTGMCHQQIQ